jgi:hypothetical protein
MSTSLILLLISRSYIVKEKNLEDHPDHHEEIQMLTPLDILTFYIYGTCFYG